MIGWRIQALESTKNPIDNLKIYSMAPLKGDSQKCNWWKSYEGSSFGFPSWIPPLFLGGDLDHQEESTVGGGNSDIFMFIPKIGEDEPILTHIFQMGWFNHQPESLMKVLNLLRLYSPGDPQTTSLKWMVQWLNNHFLSRFAFIIHLK